MELTNQPKLRFVGVDIVNVQCNVFGMPSPSDKVEKTISIDCAPKVFYPKNNPTRFNVIMALKLALEGRFDLSITAIGTFDLNSEVTEELKKVFINVNAPAIMFPYVRSFITTLSVNMGSSLGSIVLPTQFFNGELEEMVERFNA